jgi:hypothetical protein
MNNNFRNAELLGKLERHPLKATLAKALDLAENFQGDVEYLTLNKDLSPVGRDNMRRAKLRAAIRDLGDIRGPINEMQQKLDKKRAAVAIPPFDPKDVVGFLRRQELRATLRTMNTGQRELTLNDPAFADAMLEQPPILSGLFLAEDFKGTISPEIQRDRDIVAAAKQKRLGNLFAPQLAEIDELEKTVSEANGIADLARVDLKLHSGMDDRVFDEFVKPVEAKVGAPWLVKNGDAVIRVRPELKGTPGLNQPATSDEIRDGVYFESEAAFLASRAAP